jgi:hypothetical protein
MDYPGNLSPRSRQMYALIALSSKNIKAARLAKKSFASRKAWH